MEKLTMRIQRENNLNDVYILDTAGIGCAEHHFAVVKKDEAPDAENIICDIQFQKGHRNDPTATPGVLEGDLLEIVRRRLQGFQKGKFATRENAVALTHIEDALLWLSKRAADRAERNVLGTYEK